MKPIAHARKPGHPGRSWGASAVAARQHRDKGFSLVEVMVAMVIGMLGIIVMMQVFSVSEGQKRTTTGGDDAISTGAIALYGMQRDIQQSGWGITGFPVIGCNASPWGPGAAVMPLAPVTINSALITGQDANTDTLLVISGNSTGTVQGDAITGGSAVIPNVHTPTAFAIGDVVVAVSRDRLEPCPLLALTTVTGGTVAGTPPAVGTTLTLAAAAPGELLFSLGAAPTARGYAVRSGNLTTCDFSVSNCSVAANWVIIATDVVSLRAEHGVDAGAVPMTGIVSAWVHTTPTTGCALVRAPAVRFAIVARNSQPERRGPGGIAVTPVVDTWAGNDAVAVAANAAEAGNVGFVLPDPDPAWPTWQDFRYKVFQTTAPLRNITSMGAVEGC